MDWTAALEAVGAEQQMGDVILVGEVAEMVAVGEMLRRICAG